MADGQNPIAHVPTHADATGERNLRFASRQGVKLRRGAEWVAITLALLALLVAILSFLR